MYLKGTVVLRVRCTKQLAIRLLLFLMYCEFAFVIFDLTLAPKILDIFFILRIRIFGLFAATYALKDTFI